MGTLSPSHGWLDRWYQLARVGLQIGVPVRAEASTGGRYVYVLNLPSVAFDHPTLRSFGEKRDLINAMYSSSDVSRLAFTSGAMSAQEIESLEHQIEQQIEDAVEFAKNSPDPTADQLMTDIYA